jgi:hydrogenase small subunit
MAITRRQFVTRLGALAAAAGFSQAEASKIMDAMAYDTSTAPGSVYKGTFGKPRVVWLHGAECTGCSVGLLSIFENDGAPAFFGTTAPSIADAVTLAGTLPTTSEAPFNVAGGLMLHDVGLSPDQGAPASIDIADVVIDVIDLLYHETIMSMGGDTAYQWLEDFKTNNALPFVLVVEGAMQKTTNPGAWNDVSTVSWCSVAHDNNPAGGEVVPAEMVSTLGEMQACVAIIAIGQCASFGGYPGCRPPISLANAGGFNPLQSQTDAQGVLAMLSSAPVQTNALAKVVNSPGCPTNPWWFILTVVSLLVDIPAVLGQPTGTVGPLGVLKSLGTSPLGTAAHGNIGIGKTTTGFDGTARIKAVYNNPIHGPYCPRYRDFVQGKFAAVPGDSGCLQKIGCKGPAAKSLCGVHGWNNQQPNNAGATGFGTTPVSNLAPDGVTPTGGHCTRAGHPCMACTEQGYPDSFVPFIKRT